MAMSFVKIIWGSANKYIEHWVTNFLASKYRCEDYLFPYPPVSFTIIYFQTKKKIIWILYSLYKGQIENIPVFEDFRLVRNYLFWRLETTRDKARKRLKTNQDIKKTILEAFQKGDVMIIWISRTMLIYFLFWTYRAFVNRYIVGLIYPIFLVLLIAPRKFDDIVVLYFFSKFP